MAGTMGKPMMMKAKDMLTMMAQMESSMTDEDMQQMMSHLDGMMKMMGSKGGGSMAKAAGMTRAKDNMMKAKKGSNYKEGGMM